MILIYKLGSIENRNMDLTNVEKTYYQNKMLGSGFIYLQY